MYHLILIVFLSVSQQIVIEKVAVLPRELVVPQRKLRKQVPRKAWYAKYF